MTATAGVGVIATSSLPLLRDFGIIVAMNVAVALLSALVFLPPMLVWADERNWVSRGLVPADVLARRHREHDTPQARARTASPPSSPTPIPPDRSARRPVRIAGKWPFGPSAPRCGMGRLRRWRERRVRMQPTSVLLADDDARFRGIVRSLLEGDGYRVVAEAGDAERAPGRPPPSTSPTSSWSTS